VDNDGLLRQSAAQDGPVLITVTLVDPLGDAEAVDAEVSAAAGAALSEVGPALLRAVGRRDGTFYCGARHLDPDAVLGIPPLVEGAVLTVDRTGEQVPVGLLEVHVLSGPDAGAVHPLRPGEHGIGRAVQARVRVEDPDVSRLHAVLRVGLDGGSGTTVHDLGSTNGTTVDGEQVVGCGRALHPGQVLRVGDTRMTLAVPETVPVSCRPDGEGHLELNRPPRHRPAATPVRVILPVEPPERERSRFPLIAMALPLVAGIGLVAFTRSPTYLLFVLLSPLMMLGTWLADRSTGGRNRRRQEAEHAAALETCEATVRRAVTEEAAARHRAHPAPSSLLLCADGPRPRLWERRPHDPDALEVRLGLGTVPASTEVRTPGSGSRPESTVHRDLVDVPVTVSFIASGVIGLAGPRSRVLGLARWVTAQVAGWHSPRHVSLVVLSARPGRDWQWARWLPHLLPAPEVRAARRAGNDAAQVRARVDELVALLDARRAEAARRIGTAWEGPLTVVVLDGAGDLRRLPGVARLLADGPSVGLLTLCCDRDVVSLPAECGATAEVTGDVGTRLRVVTTDAGTYADVVADGVDDRWAHRFARALAPLRDATPDDSEHGLPASARLLDLIGFDALDAASLETAWRVTPRGTQVPLGVGSDGEPFVVDIARDGPHALVAGTTGSGKSELLQTLVAGLAVANRPDEMCFVLVDYKGGAAFKDCARLPHTVGTVTDLDGHLTERALRSLGAELRRRERVLRSAGCKDLDHLHAAAPPGSPGLPRLVLVVDEFATLVDELPDFVGGLVGIAQRGRSLGVHLVLATQRPSGVVSADIRANTGLRLALRVTDAAESADVVDARDAAEIGHATPGRAVVRTGSGPVRNLQTARVGGHAAETAPPVSVREVPWEAVGDPRPAPPEELAAGPTDLSRLVDTAVAAARALDCEPPMSPWLPPLPSLVTTADLDDHPDLHDRTGQDLADVGSGVTIGLLDLPTEQRRAAVTFRLDGGDHLLVAGGARSGRSTVLRTLAARLADQHKVADLHLYAVEGGGGALGPLAALPHCGAVVGRDETERADRLLTRLTEHLESRQRQLAAERLGSLEEQHRSAPPGGRLPWIVLMADGWEGLQSAWEQVDHGRPLDALLRLVREGAAVGIRVVLTGDRAALTSRVGSTIRDRLVLRLADPADYALAGIPARVIPTAMPPGRALVGHDADEAQLALLPGDPDGPGQVAAVEEVARRARRGTDDRLGTAGSAGPIRVDPLPRVVEAAELEADAKAVATGPGWALVGLGGDEPEPVGVDLDTDGPAFVVAGPPGSGRTTALMTITRWMLHQGRQVVLVSHRRSPLRALAGEPGVLATLGPPDAATLSGLVEHHPDLVVVADDAETLHDTPIERPMLTLLRPDADGASAVVVAGSAADMGSCFRGLTVEARRGRTGLLLGRLSPVDGDLLGVRLPASRGGPAGRGVLVVRGRVTPVQVAR
jgi:S-DNA-T family DNA segregation ATPase FtsK/SpoIIIE